MPRTSSNYRSTKAEDGSLFPSGLCLSGTVILRTRREVPVENPTTEIVTYTIQDDKHNNYYIDDYAPTSYYEVGEVVHLSVYIKPYKKKNGDLSYSLNIQKPYTPSTKGVAF